MHQRSISFKWIIAAVGLWAFLSLFLPPAAQAQVSIDVPGNFAGLSSQDLKQTIENIVQIILGFLGVVFILLLLYGGWTWMTSAAEPDKINKAKKIIISAVVGLLLILTSYAIALFIINSLMRATGPGAGGPGGSGGNGFGFALGAGILESHYPGRNATGVPRNTNIFVTFKEGMKRDTICTAGGKVVVGSVEIRDDNSLVTPDALDPDGNDVLDNVDCATSDDLTFRFNPGGTSADHLGLTSGETVYRVKLTAGIQKANGQPAFGAVYYDWQFTVSNIVDETPPEVTDVYPADNQTNVVRNSLVQINFSEPVDPTTASGLVPPYDQIQLTSGAATISGSYVSANQYQTTEFTSNDLCGVNSCGGNVYCLPALAVVSGRVTTGITDMAGNSMTTPFTWSFTTLDSMDLDPPVMTSRTPVKNAVNVDIFSPVEIPFNERLSAGSMNSDSIGLSRDGYDDEIAFWVKKEEVDTDGDGQADFTKALIYHDPYQPLKPYHPGVNSKVKDINQNCYYPAGCDANGDGQGSLLECVTPNF